MADSLGDGPNWVTDIASGAPACQRPRALGDCLQGAARKRMSKGDLLEMEGVIQDALGGGQYNVKVDQGGALVRAQLSGRMRRHHIRVLPGDRVRVAVSPYDLSHGLIVYRGK
jgi:translation initiation factor IF-1